MPQQQSFAVTGSGTSQSNAMNPLAEMILRRIASSGQSAQSQRVRNALDATMLANAAVNFGLGPRGDASNRVGGRSGRNPKQDRRSNIYRQQAIAKNVEKGKERKFRSAMREADRITADTAADREIASNIAAARKAEADKAATLASREAYYGSQPESSPLDALTLMGGANRDIQAPAALGPQMPRYDIPLGADPVAEQYAAQDAARQRQLEATYNDMSPDGGGRPRPPVPLDDPYGIRAEFKRQQEQLPYQTSQIGPGPVSTNQDGTPVFDLNELRGYMGTPPDENARVADLMRQRMTGMEQRGTNLNELVGVDPTLSPGMAGYVSPRDADKRLYGRHQEMMQEPIGDRFPAAQAYPGTPDMRTATQMAPPAPPITAYDRYQMGVPMNRANPLSQFFYGPIQPPPFVGPGLVRDGRYAIPMSQHPYFQQGF